MNSTFCNVALAVPLRTTFTYEVPEQLRAAVQVGVRVLVPFRQKSLVEVVVDPDGRAPEKTKIREITRVLDVIPALTPALIELGHWIAGYYLASVGEVFAILPPVTELRTQQQIAITRPGVSLLIRPRARLARNLLRTKCAAFEIDREEWGFARERARESGLNTVLQRLARRGLVEIRQSLFARKQRMQTFLPGGRKSRKSGKAAQCGGRKVCAAVAGKALEKFQA
jgi:primosomal protein N'